MKIKLYDKPEEVGYFGWIENGNNEPPSYDDKSQLDVCIGFIELDGKIIFDW